MDSKANLANRRKINELAAQHNKLTTLVACLLNELNAVKKELNEVKSGNGSHDSHSHSASSASSASSSRNNMSNEQLLRNQLNSGKFANFSDLRAEDILKQLSINSIDN